MPYFFNLRTNSNSDRACDEGMSTRNATSSDAFESQRCLYACLPVVSPALWFIASMVIGDTSRRTLLQCFSNNNITGDDLIAVQACWPVARSEGRGSAECGTEYEYDAYTVNRCGAMLDAAQQSQINSMLAIMTLLLPVLLVMRALYQRRNTLIESVGQSIQLVCVTRGSSCVSAVSEDGDLLSRDDAAYGTFDSCLLYTSPSPRD